MFGGAKILFFWGSGTLKAHQHPHFLNTKTLNRQTKDEALQSYNNVGDCDYPTPFLMGVGLPTPPSCLIFSITGVATTLVYPPIAACTCDDANTCKASTPLILENSHDINPKPYTLNPGGEGSTNPSQPAGHYHPSAKRGSNTAAAPPRKTRSASTAGAPDLLVLSKECGDIIPI